MPPTFVAEHYVTTAHFDRVWHPLAAEGLVAFVHPPIASLDRRPTSYGPITAAVGESLGLEDGVSRTIGPAMDCGAFLMTFMARGLFEKFPDLRVAFCHSGSAWLPLGLDKTETAMWLCNQRDPISLEPGQVFNNRDNLVRLPLMKAAFNACQTCSPVSGRGAHASHTRIERDPMMRGRPLSP